MKKILLTLFVLSIVGFISYLFYSKIYLRYFIVFEGKTIESSLNRDYSEVLISSGASFIGDINLNSGKIIFENNSSFSGNITLTDGFLEIGDNTNLNGNIFLGKGAIDIKNDVILNGDINFSGKINIGKNSEINGDIDKNSQLYKESSSIIDGEKPSLFVTTDYPDFLKYFDSLPDFHKTKIGYIFLTSSNMDIRGQDLDAKDYFKGIYYYEDGKLKSFDFADEEKLQAFYDNAKYYINLISDRKIDRFGVGFTTLNYAFDRKRADIYISFPYANSPLFVHEYGHVMDYAFGYTDINIKKYPYFDLENSITEYGKFHIGEDFAEAYRYYFLHNDSFVSMANGNSEIQEKYDYMKQLVFSDLVY